MAERNIVLDPPASLEQDTPLRQAIERAERAEAELAALKAKREGTTPTQNPTSLEHAADSRPAPQEAAHALHAPALHGLEALRQDAMMRHLLESLDQGVDIGHYGRLVFAMVARHFLSQQEMLTELTKDRSFSEEQAAVLLAQVAERRAASASSSGRRSRILSSSLNLTIPTAATSTARCTFRKPPTSTSRSIRRSACTSTHPPDPHS
jgi:hypothetical protein